MARNKREYNRKTTMNVCTLEDRLTPTGPVPLGPEIRVNTTTEASQEFPSVGMAANGDFVAVWGTRDANGRRAYGQRFNSLGVPQGNEFQISNDNLNVSIGNPQVLLSATGSFVVVWLRYGSGEIFARCYSAEGVPQGDAFSIHSYAPNGEDHWSSAIDTNGNWAVTWSSNGIVYCRKFNITGLPAGPEFVVSPDSQWEQRYPKIAIASNGETVITWGRNVGVYGAPPQARRFNSAGEPIGPAFNLASTGFAFDIAIDSQGNFATIGTGDGGCHVDRFTSSGISIGGSIIANTSPLGGYAESIVMDADGDFVVTWTDQTGLDGDGYGTYAQSFNSAGARLGGNFQVNTYTSHQQNRSKIAMDADGDFVIVWQSWPYPWTVTSPAGQDGSSTGVYAQRYRLGHPTVQSTQINNNEVQRSLVTSLTVNFDAVVTLPTNAADAFQLRRISDNAVVGLTATVTNDSTTHVTLSFTGGLTEFGSLADGNYQLSVLASQVSNGQLDGNSDGTPGDNYTFNFHRLFGDADGNGRVSAADFNAFRMAYGTGLSIFDFNNDGQTTAADLNDFRTRYGMTLVP